MPFPKDPVRADFLYVTEMNGIISQEKIEKETNVRITSKKVSSFGDGKVLEFLPDMIEQKVKQKAPDYLIIHKGASQISSLYTDQDMSRSKIEYYKQQIMLAAN